MHKEWKAIDARDRNSIEVHYVTFYRVECIPIPTNEIIANTAMVTAIVKDYSYLFTPWAALEPVRCCYEVFHMLELRKVQQWI